MKEMNLETLLGSWKPRRPSSKVRRRLFSGTGDPPVRFWFGACARLLKRTGGTPVPLPGFARMMRWFAPVAACGLLAVAVFHQEGGLGGAAPDVRPVALISSNQAAATYEPKVNRLPLIFEWTNRSGSAFSKGHFLPGKAN